MKFRIGISNIESDKKKVKLQLLFMINQTIAFEHIFELPVSKTFDLKLSAKPEHHEPPMTKFSDN